MGRGSSGGGDVDEGEEVATLVAGPGAENDRG